MAYRYDDRPTRGGYVRKNPYTWEYGRERDSERGMVDRASDEVSSWFGDDQAARRRRQDEARDDRYDARNDREEAWRERRDRGAMRGPRQAIGQPTGSTRVHEVMTRNVVAVRPEDPVAWGQQLYARQCAVCHSVDGSRVQGPTFKGLWGREEEMQDGTRVTVDEAYVKESIRQPQAKIVKDYGPDKASAMTQFSEAMLPDEQIAALIEYMKSLKD